MEHVPFAPVHQASEVSRLISADVRGFRHSISNQALAHLLRRHQNVTAADLEKLPTIVRVGRVSLGKDTGPNGEPRVVFRARLDGTLYEYVVEYRRRKRRLDGVTFYRV
jgi:hypothetical protein